MSRVSEFEFQPTLVGSLLTVRPLTADDFEALYAAAADPKIWAQHPESDRYKRDAFHESFFAGAVASRSAFTIQDNVSGTVIGSSRYYEWNPRLREIAIGYTFLSRSH